jgi:hypothetical protein
MTPARAPDPDLPRQPAGPPGRVVDDDDGLLIDRLRVRDPHAVSSARRARDAGTPLAAWAATALSVGAQAIELAGPAAGVDALARRVDRLADRAALAADQSAHRIAAVVDRATDPATGTVAVAVRDALGRLAHDVGGLVAGADRAVAETVARHVREATDLAAARVERAVADSATHVRGALADPAGPLAAVRDDLRREVDSTRRELSDGLGQVLTLVAVARERAGMMEKTSLKGTSYEAAVCDAVERLCAHGDTLAPSGTDVGLVAKAKSGDAVVDLAPAATGGTGARLVVEAKDTSLSSSRWVAELDNAMTNRRAHAGLGVVRRVGCMPGRRRVHVIDPCRIVVAWDPDHEDDDDLLAAAFCLARAGAIQAATAGADGADHAAVARAVEQAFELLAGFDLLDRAASNARRGVDDLAKAAATLRTQLHAVLARGLRAAGPRP